MDRNEYFMQIAELTAKRGTCDRARVGAIAVKNKRIIMSGYNGSPPGLPHCDDVGHQLINGHCVRTVHAEQNLITQAAKEGVSLHDAIVYVTHEPCFECMKLFISAGVDMVLYKNSKKDPRTPIIFYKHINIYQLNGGQLLDPLSTDKTLSDYENYVQDYKPRKEGGRNIFLKQKDEEHVIHGGTAELEYESVIFTNEEFADDDIVEVNYDETNS